MAVLISPILKIHNDYSPSRAKYLLHPGSNIELSISRLNFYCDDSLIICYSPGRTARAVKEHRQVSPLRNWKTCRHVSGPQPSLGFGTGASRAGRPQKSKKSHTGTTRAIRATLIQQIYRLSDDHSGLSRSTQ